MSILESTKRFRAAAIEKGDFVQPSRKDHRLHRKMAKAWYELYSAGDIGRDAFKSLLNDEAPHVRKWVAAQILSEGDQDAIVVLEKLTKESGLCGFSAEMTLREWCKGRLSSPFARRTS